MQECLHVGPSQRRGMLAAVAPHPQRLRQPRQAAHVRVCRRRCHGHALVITPCPHDCDERCAAHVYKSLTVSSIRQCHAVLSGALSGPASPHRSPTRRQRRKQPRSPPRLGTGPRLVHLRQADLITGARRGELVGLA
ncbi:MAG: hypothetical protein M3460_25300 [Actinomycetota bacterium]|nr:hypothetical protein [Actinomycetota bacterium]